MTIRIRGARENNLQNININFNPGLTVVTGVSGSGKSSLVFNTLYHEAHRRFLDVYLFGRGGQRLAPANVELISGLGPTIAVGQNLLNRNPNSTLASASGLHPFFRLLYTNFGERHCLFCGTPVIVFSEDEIIDQIRQQLPDTDLDVMVPLGNNLVGSHTTLLSLMETQFGLDKIIIDGAVWDGSPLDPDHPHSISLIIGKLASNSSFTKIREFVSRALSLGSGSIITTGKNHTIAYSTTRTCTACGAGLGVLRATNFNQKCPYCQGKGCSRCDQTGMHPQAASVRWDGLRLPAFLAGSVEEIRAHFADTKFPDSARRLAQEITRRLDALERVGLGYLALNRPAPTLSRGESQRVRLAISLSSQLEDMLHVLDEPTIGQHPADVARFLPAFRDLAGPVIFVEHDRIAAAVADHAVDLGPGAGLQGGEVIFQGSPADLWDQDTATGRFFSLRQSVTCPTKRPPPEEFLAIQGAQAHNLRDINIQIPLGRLSVVTGVSGSGKSTLVEHVLAPALKAKEPVGCTTITGPNLKVVMVDQSPIGRNPRSNPATYTKLSDAIRDLFAAALGLSKSHFSFNRPEGACPACKGIGAAELKMRYLPSIWLPCEVCGGQRFNPEVLEAKVGFLDQELSIADIYAAPIREVSQLLADSPWLTTSRRNSIARIIQALIDVGLGYLALGQPSPTLSGGEAQRVKLTKFLGRKRLANQLIILDEPSTGLHPQDLSGLVVILDRLVRHGATIVLVEHNTDLIKAADWVIDLGPGAGPRGGQVLYQGSPDNLSDIEDSLTGQALREETSVQPRRTPQMSTGGSHPVIAIRGARANNLKSVDVDIPKKKLTVITGVSGSGKSSLVGDVLQTEARRRYLESLSMYERQGLREGAEAPVDSITGLGVTLTVSAQQAHLWSRIPQFTRRNSVGAVTEINFHLAQLLAPLGERECLDCGVNMVRGEHWHCPQCGSTAPVAAPRHFSSAHWSSTCEGCNGLGTLQRPQPDKLIINPDKPLCAGAMYSPGYWPQSYLCKDQPIIAEIGKRYGFDPMKTPWNEMSAEAQNAYLFGDGLEYTWTYLSKAGRSKGQEKQSTWVWNGFYGEDSWLFEWDLHGTYTRQETCPSCGGAGLRPEYLAVRLDNKNIFELCELPLDELEALINSLSLSPSAYSHTSPRIPYSQLETSLHVIRKRLRFLRQVGLGYLHLNRPSGTLSAGEAQRIQLTSLLGSELLGLTILVDEPSRGMHPGELTALRDALLELRDEGNTIIVVEHDPLLMAAADHIIDIGPGAGEAGGQVIAQGTPAQVSAGDTPTGKWLRHKEISLPAARRVPTDWMFVRGARANNLRGETVSFPLGTLTGICGVSGSGKSTLLIDTLGRAMVQKLHSTSFAHEPVEPGAHDAVENAPKRAFLVDQTRRGISSPAKYLGLEKPLLKLFADSDDAHALGLTAKMLSERCTACKGQGVLRIKMDFLPDEWVPCETCRGTGYRQHAWDVAVRGLALPEINGLTINEVYDHFPDEPALTPRLAVLRKVGLGYLVWNQKAYTLSGGEVQRLKIAKELNKRTRSKTLYILDEPTVGLHLQDVARLVNVLNQLVDVGHTVLAVEHHTHLLAACDYLVELGPVGGPQGGQIIAAGTPEQVMNQDTPTAPFLRELIHTGVLS